MGKLREGLLRLEMIVRDREIWGHGLHNSIATPWGMGCATVLLPHATWVAQQYGILMGHGLYKGIDFPCSMDCTMAFISHA